MVRNPALPSGGRGILKALPACIAAVWPRETAKEGAMARKPNYAFDRKERERMKAEKKAKRAAEKAEARTNNAEAPGHPEMPSANTPTSDNE
jgi:hypothetical protein